MNSCLRNLGKEKCNEWTSPREDCSITEAVQVLQFKLSMKRFLMILRSRESTWFRNTFHFVSNNEQEIVWWRKRILPFTGSTGLYKSGLPLISCLAYRSRWSGQVTVPSHCNHFQLQKGLVIKIRTHKLTEIWILENTGKRKIHSCKSASCSNTGNSIYPSVVQCVNVYRNYKPHISLYFSGLGIDILNYDWRLVNTKPSNRLLNTLKLH